MSKMNLKKNHKKKCVLVAVQLFLFLHQEETMERFCRRWTYHAKYIQEKCQPIKQGHHFLTWEAFCLWVIIITL